MEKTSRAIANGPDAPERPAEPPRPADDAGAAALEEVFRAHAADVLRAAYRVTGSLSDAEDVLQTVFLRLTRQGTRQGSRPEGEAGPGAAGASSPPPELKPGAAAAA
ncbi:MAG: RNA polymerase sigma factor, partial [Thermoanaerobaculia bacterium]